MTWTAATPDKGLRRLDEALAGILVPGLQASHQHEIDEKIKVPSFCLTRDAQTVVHLALLGVAQNRVGQEAVAEIGADGA